MRLFVFMTAGHVTAGLRWGLAHQLAGHDVVSRSLVISTHTTVIANQNTDFRAAEAAQTDGMPDCGLTVQGNNLFDPTASIGFLNGSTVRHSIDQRPNAPGDFLGVNVLRIHIDAKYMSLI